MRHTYYLILLVLLCSKSNALPLIDSVVSTMTVARYSKFEIMVGATAIDPQALNPYDSSDVNMYAIFTSPTGTKYKRDAFWYVDYYRCNTCPNPTRPSGQDSCYDYIDAPELEAPHPDAYLSPQPNAFPWRVRFAPDATGKMERSFLLDTEKFSLQSPVKTNLDFCEQRTH